MLKCLGKLSSDEIFRFLSLFRNYDSYHWSSSYMGSQEKRNGALLGWAYTVRFKNLSLLFCRYYKYFFVACFSLLQQKQQRYIYYCSLVSISFFKSMITTATHVRRYLVVTKSSPRVASTTSFTRGLTPVC